MLFRFRPFVAFDGEETSGGGTPEPAVTPPAAPAPPAVQPGPWASDLAEYFGDNAEAIAAADRYMREKVQPSRTQFEQETAPARELYKDLVDNPESTLAEVIAELYGEERPELVDQFKALFADGTPPDPVAPTTEDDIPEWAKPMVERERAQRDAELAAEGEAAYRTALVELQKAHPDLTDADIGDGTPENRGVIHPFIAAVGGDPEQGYLAFQAYKEQLKTALGVQPVPTPEPTPAPPVLGSDGAPAATPPVQKTYNSYDEAIDDWFAERRAQAPPVVGSA